MSVLDILYERGFVEDITHKEECADYLANERATCYIGFDPTASSLHVGSLIPIMALAHMQREGHRPIALVGGGTGLVGDPSGKTELRKLLTPEIVEQNAQGIKKQLANFLDFGEGRALLRNNADWLANIKYIPFLRDFGRHFSVNRMIKAESYRMRLESEEGLNFIEFNYMLLQAYDFLELFNKHGCRIQMGGSDQWGNILAGIDLVRKIRRETVFGLTFPLITTSSGAKMGKTAKGAVWLDPERTSPYDYYQYWINTNDGDVTRFLTMFTFLPMKEIKKIEKMSGSEINAAKAVLAFEATSLAHGKDEALKAYQSAVSMFGTRSIPRSVLPSSVVPRDGSQESDDSVPAFLIEEDELKEGIPAFKLYQRVGLSPSGAAARRLIEQGGAYLNDERLASYDYLITLDDIVDSEILIRAGKKRYYKIKIKKVLDNKGM
ncbi:MAG: tyrosine--tRNA ligase [Deltaproteobacteria bacterium]|nr:tyrosine--tRNA ligase [Deltaproteobacteria bacterium]